ncbi:hypothetical protein BS78_K178900 [Paspalum vaginatum]|uniref:Uncharacterized protein n=1 Tax=Paspalum vaginatum TaxID=158149 RepID=A0A9W7XEM4_9POAL|nr:hypothetical protein BS78_K178900 [Paspalum vaginatum]
MTVLEGAIRRDCLSSDFETSECLNSKHIASLAAAPSMPSLAAPPCLLVFWVEGRMALRSLHD